MTHHLLSLTGTLAATALVGAGCGSAATTSSSQTTVTQIVTSTVTASTGTTTGSVSAGTPRCRSSQLAVAQVRRDGAAGSVGLTYRFTNRGPATCSLYGYPGLGLVGSTGSALPTSVIRSPSVVVPTLPEQTVTLAPGGHAWFDAGYSDVSSNSCPQAASLEVTPPNAYSHLTIATTIAPCSGVIHVSPVVGTRPT